MAKAKPAPTTPAASTEPAPAARRPSIITHPEQAKPAPAAKPVDVDPWLIADPAAPVAATEAEPAPATAPVASPSATESAQAPPPEAAPQVQTHSKRLVRECLDWGFTQAEIDRLPTDDLEDRLYDRQRTYRIAQQQRQQVEQPKPAPAPEPEIELPPEAAGYSDAEKTLLRKLVKPTLDKSASLEKELAELKQQFAAQQARDNRRTFDAVLDKHKTIFTDDAAGNAKKSALIGYLSNLTEKTDLAADTEAGIKLLFGSAPAPVSPPPPPPPAPAVDPLAERKKEFAEGGVARPTERVEPPPTQGEALALANLKKMLGEGRAQLVNGSAKQEFMSDWFGN